MSGPPPPPGSQPSPEQMAQIRAQFEAEAKKRGMTPQQFQLWQQQEIVKEAAKHGVPPQQYIEIMRAKAMQDHQRQQQAQAQQGKGPQGGQQMQQIPLNGSVEAKPEALALAKFLRKQDLKTRTCVLEGIRRDMFKVKRVLRVLQSDIYKKARSKNTLLPEVTNEQEAKNAMQMLPLSMLALRVEKVDPNAGHEGHNHAPKKEKRVKGLWTVKVAQRQDFEPMMHYAWIYEESSWKMKIYAVLFVIAAFTVVMFPLWPLFMRQGVWYLSMGMLGLLGLFFAMAIVRLIMFCVTVFTVPPGFWLFPNLFEDVGFFDSFKPLYGWGDNKQPKKKKAKQAFAASTAEGGRALAELAQRAASGVAPAAATTTGSDAPNANVGLTRRHEAPRVEEVADDED